MTHIPYSPIFHGILSIITNFLLQLKVVFMRPDDTFYKETEQAQMLLNNSMAEKAIAKTDVLFSKTNP